MIQASDQSSATSEPTYPVQVLDRAFAILEYLADRPARLPEISQAVDLHRATVFRLLANLEQKGYVRRISRQGPYSLGVKMFQLGTRVFQNEYPAHLFGPFLAELADETGETTQIWIRDGDQAICIDQCDSRADLQVTNRVGRALPIYSAAAPKVLLAHAPAEVRNRVLFGPLEAVTEMTLTSPDVLKRDLVQIRQDGYKLSAGEVTPLTAGIAAPIFNSRGDIVAALNILGTAQHVNKDNVDRLLPHLLKTVETISSELGHQSETA